MQILSQRRRAASSAQLPKPQFSCRAPYQSWHNFGLPPPASFARRARLRARPRPFAPRLPPSPRGAPQLHHPLRIAPGKRRLCRPPHQAVPRKPLRRPRIARRPRPPHRPQPLASQPLVLPQNWHAAPCLSVAGPHLSGSNPSPLGPPHFRDRLAHRLCRSRPLLPPLQELDRPHPRPIPPRLLITRRRQARSLIARTFLLTQMLGLARQSRCCRNRGIWMIAPDTGILT